MECCKKCGSVNLVEVPKPPHLGLYCGDCNAWIKWIKHTATIKTKEEYRNEYLSKQPATEAQCYYIRNKIRQMPPSKTVAHKIIELLGGAEE